MVKLAQHIEWPSKLPLKASEGATGSGRSNVKKADQVTNGKPRKTLAELFESRAMPSPSFSTSTTTTTTTTTTAATTSTSLPSSARSSSACSSTTSSSTSSSSAQAHVTFQDKLSATSHKHAARSSELAGGIKRSSSARKIADSSRHEGTYSHPSSKKTSKSGPLAQSEPLHRNPLTNASDSEPNSRWISPVKLRTGHTNGKSNENPLRNSSTFEQEQRTAKTNLINLEQRSRSPLAKFRTNEHNQNNFLLKSIDSVESLQNAGRFRQNAIDTTPVGKRLDAENADRVQAVQGTLTKGKKLRKGLLALLTDSGNAKHSGEQAMNSGNVKHLGGEARGFVSPPRRVSGNVGISTKHMDGEMRHYQNPGSKMSGNLGKEGRESKSVLVEIPDKMVGLAWMGVEPRLLSSGSYSFPLEGFLLEQVVSERSSYVKHGMLHRVRIREGHLGVAWVDGKAVLLEPGVSVHVCPSNKFSYITTDDKMVLEKEFVLGPFRVVTVDDSEVGIKFCNRQPQILYSGRHCLSISKVEVFAGFESLLRRQSTVSDASAMSNDSMKVSADMWVEWQIKAEDAAAARLANITDVEGAVCSNARRAFNLVFWDVNAHDMKLQLTRGTETTANTDPHPLLTTLSANIRRECQDLFEEGWTVTIWDLQLRQLVILSEVKDAQG